MDKFISRRKLFAGGMAFGVALPAIAKASNAQSKQDISSITLTSQTSQLSSAEIKRMLIGNTLVGILQDGDQYRLFLDLDGNAYVNMDDGREEIGRWTLLDNGLIKSRFPSVADNDELTMSYFYAQSSNEFFNIVDHGQRWGKFHVRQGDAFSMKSRMT